MGTGERRGVGGRCAPAPPHLPRRRRRDPARDDGHVGRGDPPGDDQGARRVGQRAVGCARRRRADRLRARLGRRLAWRRTPRALAHARRPPRSAACRRRLRAQARATRVVPRSRHPSRALDVRPVGRPQRASEREQAGSHVRPVPSRLLRTDARLDQRGRPQRPARGPVDARCDPRRPTDPRWRAGDPPQHRLGRRSRPRGRGRSAPGRGGRRADPARPRGGARRRPVARLGMA